MPQIEDTDDYEDRLTAVQTAVIFLAFGLTFAAGLISGIYIA